MTILFNTSKHTFADGSTAQACVRTIDDRFMVEIVTCDVDGLIGLPDGWDDKYKTEAEAVEAAGQMLEDYVTAAKESGNV